MVWILRIMFNTTKLFCLLLWHDFSSLYIKLWRAHSIFILAVLQSGSILDLETMMLQQSSNVKMRRMLLSMGL